MTLEDIRTTAVAISALVAALSLGASAFNQIRARRDKTLSNWRMVVVHQIFEKSPSDELSFDEIVRNFRSEAVAYEKYQIRAGEMSSEVMRSVVLELLSRGVLSQASKNSYVLNERANIVKQQQEYGKMMERFISRPESPTPNIMEMMGGLLNSDMMKMSATMSRDYEIRNVIFRLVAEDPDKYNVSDLAAKVARETDTEYDLVKSRVAQLLGSRNLSADAQGRIGLGPKALSSPAIGDEYDQ
jgi:hypothetical protein